MELIQTEQDRFLKAKNRIEEIKGFYGNLISYVLVNALLLFINLTTSPEYLWFFWPLFGWGIGILFHALKVFNYAPFLGKEWEERKMKEFMQEQKLTATKWH